MGVASVALHFASRIYMPSALGYADSHYGELGVAFTCIGWLFAVAFVLITATVVGVVVALEPGPAARFLARRSVFPTDSAAPDEGALIPQE
jgi:membrane protein